MSPQHSYDSSHRIKHMFFPQPLSPVVVIFLASSATAAVSQGLPGRQLSIYLSIHPSIHLSISPVYLTVYLAIDPSTYQSINLSIYLSIYLSLSLQDPPNRGVGGTRALAHFIYIYIYRYWHYWHTHEIPMEFHGIHPLSIAKPFCSGMEMEKSWITAGSNP